MLFSQFRKNTKLMKGYTVILYAEQDGEKLYHDILPVGFNETGHKTYKGLMLKKERDYYDSVFKEYGDYVITDKDIDDEYKIIYLHIIENFKTYHK